MKKKTRRIRLAGCLTVLALVAAVGFAKACEPYRNQEIGFSEEERFWDSDLTLELSTFLKSEIYYTLDGSRPSRETARYERPIRLEAGEECRGIPVRAIAYYEDGTQSDVYTRTYFLGKNVKHRFSTLVVAITGDPEELFDYEKGILVTGKLRDDYVLEHPDEWISNRDPANYNVRGDAGERVVQVEMWEPDGTQILDEELGIRVNGGLSRGLDVKSLRLIAREQYGGKRIRTELFPENQGEETGTAGQEPTFPKRVVLRNHGNDQEYGYLRNELGAQLAADAGFPCSARYRAASVWINGEYYGFEWLEDYFDRTYLNNLYQSRPDEGSWRMAEPFREDDQELTEEEQQAKQDLQEVMSYYHYDLTDDRLYEELAARLDIDNFLRYCAVEMFVANVDWPDNNCKAYRWYSDIGDYSGAGTDGKWRFLLYDLDLSMGRIPETHYSTHPLALALGGESVGWRQEFPLLKELLKREDVRAQFAAILEKYAEGAFSTAHVETVLEQIEAEMDGELSWQIRAVSEKEAVKEGETFGQEYQEKVEQHQQEIRVIREFWEQRPAVILEEIRKLPEYMEQLED